MVILRTPERREIRWISTANATLSPIVGQSELRRVASSHDTHIENHIIMDAAEGSSCDRHKSRRCTFPHKTHPKRATSTTKSKVKVFLCANRPTKRTPKAVPGMPQSSIPRPKRAPSPHRGHSAQPPAYAAHHGWCSWACSCFPVFFGGGLLFVSHRTIFKFRRTWGSGHGPQACASSLLCTFVDLESTHTHNSPCVSDWPAVSAYGLLDLREEWKLS